jgi:hypothetical protein
VDRGPAGGRGQAWNEDSYQSALACPLQHLLPIVSEVLKIKMAVSIRKGQSTVARFRIESELTGAGLT